MLCDSSNYRYGNRLAAMRCCRISPSYPGYYCYSCSFLRPFFCFFLFSFLVIQPILKSHVQLSFPIYLDSFCAYRWKKIEQRFWHLHNWQSIRHVSGSFLFAPRYYFSIYCHETVTQQVTQQKWRFKSTVSTAIISLIRSMSIKVYLLYRIGLHV